MKFRKELVGASTNMLVLKMLAGEELHGYEIVRRIDELSQGEMRWREGAIYPVLHKMEKAGLIEGRWMDATAGKLRRVYTITSEGRRELNAYSSEWQNFAGIVNRILEVRHA